MAGIWKHNAKCQRMRYWSTAKMELDPGVKVMKCVNLAGVVIIFVFVCTSAVLAQNCNCAGTWNTGWTGQSNSQNISMVLQQSGNTVAGTYDYDSGRIEGTIEGNLLTGTWTQSSTSGTFQFQLADDCNSFHGSWRFGSSGGWEGNWVGTRTQE
jgi:hypothetical protein